MKKSYLNSERNSVVSLRPSMTIRLLLMVLFVCLFTNTTVTAQISTLSAWTNTYHGTSTAQQNVTYTVPAGSGTNRILVVAIASSQTATGTARSVTLTYGGQTLTSVNGDMATTTVRQHTQLYYLKETGLDAATSTTLAITVSGGTTRITDVFSAVFDGVDQATPITNSRTYTGSTTAVSTVAFGPTLLAINANDLAVEIISSVRAANTTPRTISTYAANWTTASVDQTWTTTDAVRNVVASRSVPIVNSTDASTTTLSGTSLASMTGISLKCAPTTIPTITSLGSLSGCVGSSISINGTNLGTVIAANLKIGGTAVTSLTCNVAGTQIVAVIGSGTTGVVTAKNYWGTETSADTFTVNALPITSIITGSTAVCANSTGNVYSVSNTASSTYAWTLPTGASIISGLGTNSITVTFGATSGNVAVTETNGSGCVGTQVTSAITVNPLPTITLGVNPSICVNVGTAYIPYTSTSGNPDGYGVDFDGVANAAGFVDFSNWALTAGQLALIIPNGGYNITPGVYNGNLTVYNNTTTCTSVNYPISVTVNPNEAASVSIAASPSGAICVGTSVTFTATPAFGGATPTYQWKLNGGIVGTNSATYTNAALANGNTVVCSMTSSSTCATGSPATSNAVTVSVNPAPNIGLTVGGTSPICTGSGTNITVASSVSGTTYQLRNGTTNIGSSVSGTGGTINLPTGNLSATTTFNVLATNTATGCLSQLTQTKTITVNQLPNAAGTISGPTAVCQGQAVAYLVPIIGNITNTSSYVWAYLGSGVTFSNATNNPTVTFASNATSGNLTVYGVNSCGNGTISAIYPITVNPLPTTPTLTAGGATTFCAGGSVVLTSSSSANGYVWYKDGTLISGATSQSYSATTSGSYTVKVINASGCQSATSSAIGVTVSASPTIEFTQGQNDKTYTISAASCGDISGGNQNDLDIFSGNPGGSATYQWQVSYDGMASWSNGPGPTATTTQYVLNPVYTFYEKVAGVYYFRIIITNNGCAAISDTIKLTVTAGSGNLSSGTIAGNQNYCASNGNPNPFTETVAATGGDGNGYNYQWQSSTDNVNFANINTNATNSTYDPPSISITTYYRRIVSSGSCTAISNTVAVSIQRPAVSVIQTSCSYKGTITVISPAPSGTTITYNVTCPNPVVSISNTTGIFSNLAPGTYTVTDNVSGCQSFGTTVIINGTPTLATAPSASAVFQPTISVPTGIITVSPITSGYAYSIDGIDYSNTTGIFYSVAPGTYNVTAMNGAGCPPSAATVVIIGALTATPTITASGPTSFCAGGSVTLTSSAGTSYLWSTNETTASITPTTSGSYTVRVTSNTYQSAPSAATVVTVNPLPTAPTISASGPISFCIGGSVTLTSSTGSTYLWSTGATTQSISPTTAGSYTVQVTNANGCQSASSSATVVTVNPLPATPTITPNRPTTFCVGGSVTLNSSAGTTYLWSTGATTQSISPTTAGSYSVKVTNANGCQSVSSTPTVVTVNPLPIAPTITANGPTTLCAGGSVTLTSSAGSTYLWSTNETTASISPTTSGSYSVKVTNANGCQSVSSIATVVTVNSLLATPSVSTTQPACATPTTGTITVTAPIAVGMTYSIDGLTYTNTTGIFTMVDIGTYDVTAKNSSGCISAVKSVTISPLVTNTWAAGAWSNGTPTAEQNIVFDGVYPPLSPALNPNVDIVGCSCQINAGADVTIKTGHTLKLTNELVVDGFLTFEDKASLVQINDVTNTGDIDYLRTTDTGIYNTDYIYWSSPVGGITLGDVSQNRTLSDKYYSYVPTATGEDWQQESSLTPMESGSGYIIRGSEYSPSVLPGVKYTATFTGVPNNGHYEITPIYADKSYLLGNPYPSALDADTFLADNAGVLNGTLYFWTHNTDMQARGSILSSAGSGAFAYTTNDYATYNATGGVGASPPDQGGLPGVNTAASLGSSPRTNLNTNTQLPLGKIASGQGFFASTKTGVTNTKIVFDNTMRVGVDGITGNNSQFFKTKNPKGKSAKAIEKNRIWLNLTNAEGAFKQALVGYLTDATNDYDDRFDGESFDGNEFVDFYSVNQDRNLTIQGRALPFDENDQVPLGYRTTINGDFTINIDQADGSLANQAVFIEDKLTNTVTDLKSGNYTFNTAAGTFNDRFVLKYTNKTLSVDAMDKEDGILVLYSNNYKTLIIHNNVMNATVNTVALYNITGQKISNWDVKDSEQTTIQIPIKNISSGIYIVKVNTTTGESSKKIIVN